MSDPRREAARRALSEIRRAHGIVPVSPDPDGWTCPECGAGVTAVDVGKIDGTLTNDEWRGFGGQQSQWSRDPIDRVYEHRHPETRHVDHPRHSSRGTVRATHPEIDVLSLGEIEPLRKEWRRLARKYEKELQ